MSKYKLSLHNGLFNKGNGKFQINQVCLVKLVCSKCS